MKTKDYIPYTITPSEKYPRSELQVELWIAEKNGFANRRKSVINIKKETEKAFLVEFVTGVAEEHWMPKSVCKVVNRTEKQLDFY